MASTLTPTTFNVKIIEEQVVKSNTIKNQTTHTISNVSNVDRRTVTCPLTTSITLFNLDSTNPGAGTFVSSSLEYARVTNLDDTNNLAIIISGSQGTITQKVTPSNTLFIASSNITSSKFNGTFGDNIESVKAFAIGGSIDVDYTIVNS